VQRSRLSVTTPSRVWSSVENPAGSPLFSSAQAVSVVRVLP
jgi:hypothetical protein